MPGWTKQHTENQKAKRAAEKKKAKKSESNSRQYQRRKEKMLQSQSTGNVPVGNNVDNNVNNNGNNNNDTVVGNVVGNVGGTDTGGGGGGGDNNNGQQLVLASTSRNGNGVLMPLGPGALSQLSLAGATVNLTVNNTTTTTDNSVHNTNTGTVNNISGAPKEVVDDLQSRVAKMENTQKDQGKSIQELKTTTKKQEADIDTLKTPFNKKYDSDLAATNLNDYYPESDVASPDMEKASPIMEKNSVASGVASPIMVKNSVASVVASPILKKNSVVSVVDSPSSKQKITVTNSSKAGLVKFGPDSDSEATASHTNNSYANSINLFGPDSGTATSHTNNSKVGDDAAIVPTSDTNNAKAKVGSTMNFDPDAVAVSASNTNNNSKVGSAINFDPNAAIVPTSDTNNANSKDGSTMNFDPDAATVSVSDKNNDKVDDDRTKNVKFDTTMTPKTVVPRTTKKQADASETTMKKEVGGEDDRTKNAKLETAVAAKNGKSDSVETILNFQDSSLRRKEDTNLSPSNGSDVVEFETTKKLVTTKQNIVNGDDRITDTTTAAAAAAASIMKKKTSVVSTTTTTKKVVNDIDMVRQRFAKEQQLIEVQKEMARKLSQPVLDEVLACGISLFGKKDCGLGFSLDSSAWYGLAHTIKDIQSRYSDHILALVGSTAELSHRQLTTESLKSHSHESIDVMIFPSTASLPTGLAASISYVTEKENVKNEIFFAFEDLGMEWTGVDTGHGTVHLLGMKDVQQFNKTNKNFLETNPGLHQNTLWMSLNFVLPGNRSNFCLTADRRGVVLGDIEFSVPDPENPDDPEDAYPFVFDVEELSGSGSDPAQRLKVIRKKIKEWEVDIPVSVLEQALNDEIKKRKAEITPMVRCMGSTDIGKYMDIKLVRVFPSQVPSLVSSQQDDVMEKQISSVVDLFQKQGYGPRPVELIVVGSGVPLVADKKINPDPDPVLANVTGGHFVAFDELIVEKENIPSPKTKTKTKTTTKTTAKDSRKPGKQLLQPLQQQTQQQQQTGDGNAPSRGCRRSVRNRKPNPKYL